jgi:hypothetical protein
VNQIQDVKMTPLSAVKKELIMGPPTPAAQKTTARPVISAPEIAKEVVEKRPLIPSGNGPVILEQRTLPEYCRLNINCAVPLAENVNLFSNKKPSQNYWLKNAHVGSFFRLCFLAQRKASTVCTPEQLASNWCTLLVLRE